jgi:putative transposase
VIGAWRAHDNRIKPHSALGYRPPAPAAAAAIARQLPTPAIMQ